MKNIIKLLVLSILIFLHPVISHCQNSNVAFSTLARINQDSLHNIDLFLEKAIDNQWIAGAVALVAVNGQIVYENAFGYKSIAQNETMKTSDIFRLLT